MALTPIEPLKFQLFIPTKTMQKVEQPGYGTDMRVIENGVNLFINKLVPEFNEAIAEIATALAEIDQIVNIDIPKTEFLSVMVGTTPPDTVQLINQYFAVTTTFTTGLATIPLSGFTHGWTALIAPASGGGSGSIAIDISASTLTSLALEGTAVPAGTNLTGPYTIACNVIGA